MNLYKISQHVNNTWDTFSDAVVVAVDAEQAKKIHPEDGRIFHSQVEKGWFYSDERFIVDWAHPRDIAVEYIGQAAEQLTEPGVVCASYHAG